METVYYNLDARRVSTHEMASGETAPQCRSYAVLRKVEEKRAGESGKVLDLESYRCKLSAQPQEACWDEEKRYETVIPAPVPVYRTTAKRRRRLCLSLDVFATLAILVMATVVVVVFLPFL